MTDKRSFFSLVSNQAPAWALFIVACCFFEIRFGFATLNPSNIDWFLSHQRDFMNVFLQTQYCIQNYGEGFPGVWGLKYPSEFAPIYTNIMWPVMKVTHWLTGQPFPFQHFGIWFFICTILQAFGAYWSFGQMGIKEKWIRFFGALILFFSPFLLDRSEHVSFYPHWLIVLSLGLYFSRINVLMKYTAFTALACFSSSIQPYMAFMVYAIFSAAAMKDILYSQTKKIVGVLFLVVSILLSLGIFFALGYRPSASGLGVSGYGTYNANMNTLFNNMGKTLIPINLPLANFEQYEGFGYVGAGVLLALLIALIQIKPILQRVNSKSAIPLLLCVGLLGAYAIMPSITFNGQKLIQLDFNFGTLGALFRTNGRFIWPLSYTAMMLSIVGLYHLPFKKKHIYILVGSLALLQVVDNSPYFKKAQTSALNKNFDPALWNSLFKEVDQVITLPMYTPSLASFGDASFFVFEASKYNRPITCGFFGRGDWAAPDRFRKKTYDFLKNPQGDQYNNSIFISGVDRSALLKKLSEHEDWIGYQHNDYVFFIHSSNNRAQLVADSFKLDKPSINVVTIKNFLQKNKGNICAIVSRDEATYKLDAASKQYADSIGLNLSKLQFRHSYAALFDGNTVFCEQYGPVCIDTLLAMPNGQTVQLIASGNKLDCDKAQITIGNYTSKSFDRGLKILVFDATGKVIEEGQFDTYLSPYQVFD